uniref:Protein phosphatase 1 regulatory subunit 27 n=1 Tax=Paramormyrops kingsleyae TaxID=1676925 RepID=A0A3B3S0G0_9TELE|nr:protein phosphatase 1 regulatory subunit 27-like [Paramormyrops kingsleyae]
MKDILQYPTSQLPRYSHYSPVQYRKSSYTATLYTPTHYTPTAHYTPKQNSSTRYTASNYTPSHYTPSHYTPSHYTPSKCGRTQCRSSPVALKPARSVRFPNDIVFQDHIRQGDLEQIGRFLRAKKVRLDTIYLSGMAALHEAVLTGNLECVKLLVKYGADVHQRDEDGWTPLHMACSDGYPDIARYLLSLGASVEAKNESGEKPGDLIDADCKELVQLFAVGCA